MDSLLITLFEEVVVNTYKHHTSLLFHLGFTRVAV